MADDPAEKKPPAPAPRGGILGGLDSEKLASLSQILRESASRLYPDSPAREQGPLFARVEAEEEPQGAVTGRGDNKPAKRRKPRRTSLDRVPGSRPMKEYPLTSSELLTLGVLQGGSALSFAAAGGCLGFWLSVEQTVDFAGKDVAATTIGWWQGIGSAALAGAVFFGLIGLAMFLISGFNVWKIKRDTDHGEG